MRIAWFVVGLAGCGPSAGDCTVSVPGSAAVVRDGEQFSDATGSAVYVCPGATAQVDAANQTLYVGAGATVEFSGANSTVYADSGARVTAGGADTVVYAEGDATVELNATGQDLLTCKDLVLEGEPSCG